MFLGNTNSLSVEVLVEGVCGEFLVCAPLSGFHVAASLAGSWKRGEGISVDQLTEGPVLQQRKIYFRICISLEKLQS